MTDSTRLLKRPEDRLRERMWMDWDDLHKELYYFYIFTLDKRTQRLQIDNEMQQKCPNMRWKDVLKVQCPTLHTPPFYSL